MVSLSSLRQNLGMCNTSHALQGAFFIVKCHHCFPWRAICWWGRLHDATALHIKSGQRPPGGGGAVPARGEGGH